MVHACGGGGSAVASEGEDVEHLFSAFDSFLCDSEDSDLAFFFLDDYAVVFFFFFGDGVEEEVIDVIVVDFEIVDFDEEFDFIFFLFYFFEHPSDDAVDDAPVFFSLGESDFSCCAHCEGFSGACLSFWRRKF